MPTRREFLIKSVAGALIVSMPRIVFANTNNKAINATAITQVFGDGVRLIAIAAHLPHRPVSPCRGGRWFVDGIRCGN